MARFVPFICILLLALGYQQPARANPLIIAKAVFQFGMEAYQDFQQIKAFLDRPPTADEELSSTDVKIFGQLNEISAKISNMQNTLLNKISKDLQDKLSVKLDDMFQHIRDVQRIYKTFSTYTEHLDEVHNATLARFVKSVTNSDLHKLSTTVQKMHEALTTLDLKYESVLSILSDRTNTDLMCIRSQSPQQIIYDLYKTLLITDAQSLIVKLFAYEKLEQWQNKKYRFEKDHETKDFNTRISNTYIHVKDAMIKASRELYKCDPARHVKGRTYWKLQEVFQAYFQFEHDFSGETCSWKCPTMNGYQPECESNHCKSKAERKKCHGYIDDCQSVHSSMSVCNAKDKSDRRYLWMETGSGTVYGQKRSSCNSQVEKRDSYYKGFYNCEHCMCTCISHEIDVDRHFSLSEVTSDTLNNMVVTGVRFKVDNHIFHIQIQQGRLQRNGTIDPESVTWKPIDNKITDLHSKEFYTKNNINWIFFNENKKIYTVDTTRNTVYLDDIEPEAESPTVSEVVTGLRFQPVGNDLKLEIQRTVFDYATGTLKSKSNWHSNHKTRDSRKPVSLQQPIDPTLVNANNDVSPPKRYVTFRMSDLEKDLGQTTVPFIDIQNVESNPPVPMSGAGIFHRGGENSGGFLSLKLIEYDISKHM